MSYNIKLSNGVFEEMNSNSAFNDFVGKCISLFLAQGIGGRGVVEVPEDVSDMIDEICIQSDSDDTIWVTEDGYSLD